ncbi:polyprenyl synthetase family protein [Pararhizobium mangrovi]|uniref:Probable farnesyl diphosphate synthase n=1 Tax=Pararhizobium mangrovi TaxID=2590452 RepID=A0A506UAJ6_9HYPH|nr:polyprenyl synthetase family protein [Pararhizobium mangrovi]TPW29609.1 polyprenyl synthetase family protein [Pararhizobium mangrovi]
MNEHVAKDGMKAGAGSRGDLAAAKALVEARLAALVPAAPAAQPELGEAMRDALLSGGKRLRPLMCMAATADLGADPASAVDAGSAIEFVHAASLVLDDLPCMDDAAMRRGRPTIHLAHGEDLAVLTAVSLLTGASEVLADIEVLPCQTRLACVRMLASATGAQGLCAGQFADLRGGRGPRDGASIAAANDLKTGSLFRVSVGFAGLIAQADAATRERLDGFARSLGLAFQLMDDLLDQSGRPSLSGKDCGQDAGKSTMVTVFRRGAAEDQIRGHIGEAKQCLETLFGPKSRLGDLVDMIVAHGEALRGPGMGRRTTVANDLPDIQAAAR